jgi:hypothetical protein
MFRNFQILTVKPGDDDYVDTSFLLRQASPYMKIKYYYSPFYFNGNFLCFPLFCYYLEEHSLTSDYADNITI